MGLFVSGTPIRINFTVPKGLLFGAASVTTIAGTLTMGSTATLNNTGILISSPRIHKISDLDSSMYSNNISVSKPRSKIKPSDHTPIEIEIT